MSDTNANENLGANSVDPNTTQNNDPKPDKETPPADPNAAGNQGNSLAKKIQAILGQPVSKLRFLMMMIRNFVLTLVDYPAIDSTASIAEGKISEYLNHVIMYRAENRHALHGG